MDPRRSVSAAVIGLLLALAASLTIASLWASRVARDVIVQQRLHTLAIEADQLASDLGQAASTRLAAVHAAALSTDASPAAQFKNLVALYPSLGWIAAADSRGAVIATDGSMSIDSTVATTPWFSQGLRGPWIGSMQQSPASTPMPLFGDLAAPLKDASGRSVGVIAAHLSWEWALGDAQRFKSSSSAQLLVLNRAGLIVLGADSLRGAAWKGLPEKAALSPAMPAAPHFERMPDGSEVLVARAAVSVQNGFAPGEWQVQLSEPKALVYQDAAALARAIMGIAICLGVAIAILGALGARRLTKTQPRNPI